MTRRRAWELMTRAGAPRTRCGARATCSSGAGNRCGNDRPVIPCASMPLIRSGARCRSCWPLLSRLRAVAADTSSSFSIATRKPSAVRSMPAWFHIVVADLVGGDLCGTAIDKLRNAPVGRASAARGSRVTVSRSCPTCSANTSPSRSEFEARRFAPWTPVRDTSPHAHSRSSDDAAREIDDDAAHHVVRGRRDRNQVLQRIDATRAEQRVDPRETGA